MATQLNNDIWYMVIDILRAKFDAGSQGAKESLLALRLTQRSLAVAIAPILLSYIEIRKLDRTSYDRLNSLLRSAPTCEAVKTYDLHPSIIRSRQGELSSAYHKIPPHLDYGRNSASPVIRDENRSLRIAAAQWEQQYRIVYPPQSKAAAFIKKTFQWSGSRTPGLKNSIYFTAFASFTNLSKFMLRYPTPENSRLVHDVASEYSIALGRYLATCPTALSEIQIRSITPQYLAAVVRSMKKHSHQNPRASTQVTTLDLFIEPYAGSARKSLHGYPEIGHFIATFLQHMPKLTNLKMIYHADGMETSPLKLEHLLVSPITPPALPELKVLMLGGLAFSGEELLALITKSPTRLTSLVLDSISLTSLTWARIFRTFAQNETLEYVLQPTLVTGMAYYEMPEATTRTYQTKDDHKGHLEWEKKIDERLRQSSGQGLPRSARLQREFL